MQAELDLKKLSARFKADINVSAYHNFHQLQSLEKKIDPRQMENLLGFPHSSRRKSALIKTPNPTDQRIFSHYFAHVMVSKVSDEKNLHAHQAARVFEPMRYRLRPAEALLEIPSKYNLFNARLDSLETRPLWRKLFKRRHGIFPFLRFFEWVEVEGKKKLISFQARNHPIMWAPCLWDEWFSPDQTLHFKSFAILTDDPPPEIAARGHDRCPIFLQEKYFDDWLNPQDHSQEKIYQLLKQQEKTFFDYQLIET